MWKGKLYKNHILAPYTTWKIGGPAQYFYEPLHLEDLVEFMQHSGRNDKLTWLGSGSKVLIREGGIKGIVIRTRDRLLGIAQVKEPYTIRVEAGVSCSKLIHYCLRSGLVGHAYLTGIPGTIGGALVMNAGTYGSSIWQNVVAVETMDENGDIHIRQAKEFNTGYRLGVDDTFKEWFVAAYLKFAPGDTKQEMQKVQELLQKRRMRQPLEMCSCGSVFKNTLSHHAGRLIESCGLKGTQRGAAQVSEQHANFIVHVGDAKSSDVEDLIKLVHDTVLEKTEVDLKLEAKIIGESGK